MPASLRSDALSRCALYACLICVACTCALYVCIVWGSLLGTGVTLKSRPPCESLPDPTGVRAREGRGGGGGEGEEGCEVRRVLLQIYIQIYSTNLQIVLHIVSCQLTHFVYMCRRQSAHTTRCMSQHAPASALYGALSRCALYVCIVCVPYMCALSVHLIWVSLMLRRTTSTLSVCTKK